MPFAAGTRAMPVSLELPPVVAICGEVDIQSAPELRDELLRLIRRRGPERRPPGMEWRETEGR